MRARLHLAVALVMGVVCLFGMAAQAHAFKDITAQEVQAMLEAGDPMVVIDIRDESGYCSGHVQCALHLEWNNGDLYAAALNMDRNAKYVTVCSSSQASASAAQLLDSMGFIDVNNMLGGMNSWPYTKYLCGDEEPCDITFPHAASNDMWETEVGIINTNGSIPFSGTLEAKNAAGDTIQSIEMDIPPLGRRALIVGDAFDNPQQVAYLKLETGTNALMAGYTKFWIPGTYRVGVPATTAPSASDMLVPHIASDDMWWTGLALVNTTDADHNLMIMFNDGTVVNRNLAAGAHDVFSISDLFGGVPQPELGSAKIIGSAGLVGVELFGGLTESVLSGVALSSNVQSVLQYPHVADDPWWTGLVAYNPNPTAVDLGLQCYDVTGDAILPPIEQSLEANGRLVGTAQSLNLPMDCAWFTLNSSQAITGLELFGRSDAAQQLGGFSTVRPSYGNGFFGNYDTEDWTGLAMVNPGTLTAHVAVTALNDAGQVVTASSFNLAPKAKMVVLAEELFAQPLTGATHIMYSSDQPISGFQLNGSMDETMLDALPVLY